MHRRFSLPGPVQPHSRPIAEFRASANKSLDMLRQTIQSAVTREIDQVIKKYLEVTFVFYEILSSVIASVLKVHNNLHCQGHISIIIKVS